MQNLFVTLSMVLFMGAGSDCFAMKEECNVGQAISKITGDQVERITGATSEIVEKLDITELEKAHKANLYEHVKTGGRAFKELVGNFFYEAVVSVKERAIRAWVWLVNKGDQIKHNLDTRRSFAIGTVRHASISVMEAVGEAKDALVHFLKEPFRKTPSAGQLQGLGLTVTLLEISTLHINESFFGEWRDYARYGYDVLNGAILHLLQAGDIAIAGLEYVGSPLFISYLISSTATQNLVLDWKEATVLEDSSISYLGLVMAGFTAAKMFSMSALATTPLGIVGILLTTGYYSYLAYNQGAMVGNLWASGLNYLSSYFYRADSSDTSAEL